MSVAAKLRRAPARIVTGAFILDSGISKLNGDEAKATALHGMACGTYPFLEKVPPKTFWRALAVGEIALGSALLLPIVPAGLAGMGLVAFSSGLMTMWWRTPGMHEDGSPRPTQQGTAIAKDAWLFGIGSGLMLDAIAGDSGATRAVRRAERKAAKAEHAVAKLEHKSAGAATGAGLVARASGMAEAEGSAKGRAEAIRKGAEGALKEAQDRATGARKAAKARRKTAKKAARARTEVAQDIPRGQAKATRAAGKPTAAAARGAAAATKSAADAASASAHRIADQLA
jgi:uncharacterized membrane protein YphA (DoxX/SURF4 family)